MVTGIIYRIVCNETGEVYYGSTQQSLNVRMAGHKRKCKAWKEGNCHYITSFSIIERCNYSYSLIETVECEDRKQLEKRERFYIENNDCINHVIPGRTREEYKNTHKEEKKEMDKVYNEKNKDKIKEQRKSSEKDKRYYEANKERLNEKQRRKRAKAKELLNQ